MTAISFVNEVPSEKAGYSESYVSALAYLYTMRSYVEHVVDAYTYVPLEAAAAVGSPVIYCCYQLLSLCGLMQRCRQGAQNPLGSSLDEAEAAFVSGQPDTVREQRGRIIEAFRACFASLKCATPPRIWINDALQTPCCYDEFQDVIAINGKWFSEAFSDCSPETFTAIVQSVVAHEMGHRVFSDVYEAVQRNALETLGRVALGFTSCSLPVLFASFFAIHYLESSMQHYYEFRADAYAAQWPEYGKGLCQFLYRVRCLGLARAYTDFLEQGFSEEQAVRLAEAHAPISYSHPLEKDRSARIRLLREKGALH